MLLFVLGGGSASAGPQVLLMSTGQKKPPAEAGGGAHQFVRAVYCTFAVTDAFAFNVSVQILALLAPLEHAPLQTASRPLVTLSVTAVPGANCADPVLPVATLRP